jgi:hypothetical protein
MIRPPGWVRTLYIGAFISSVTLASILLFVGQSALTTAVSLVFWLIALASLPIALASSIRRMELSGDKLVLVRLQGRMECSVGDIASMRLAAVGNGMAQCVLLRQDGNPVFHNARHPWRTSDLSDLAARLKIPVAK